MSTHFLTLSPSPFQSLTPGQNYGDHHFFQSEKEKFITDKQSGNLHYIIVPTVLKIVKLHTPIVFVYKLWIIFKRNKKHTKLIKSHLYYK